MSSFTISVVVPVLDEINALPVTLTNLLAHDNFEECVVVDGGSTDGSVAFLQDVQDPRVRLIRSARGRGRQLNAGVAASGGDCLLFHHADTLLPKNAFTQIRDAVDRGARWGGFRHCFSEPNATLRFISTLHNFRCRMTGVVYGDQSMFAMRGLVEEIGGFPNAGLEDLVFSDNALRHSASVLLPGYVVTNSRKFKQIGEWRALWHVLSIIRRYQRGAKIENRLFFEDYR